VRTAARFFERGSALAETAISLAFVMLCLLGAMEIALLGIYQLELDGSTFFFAHSYAVGSTDVPTLRTTFAALFPNVPTSLTSPAFYAPATTTEPVNFTQWGSLNNRYGGASVVRPQRVGVNQQLTGSFGVLNQSSTTMYSTNVEGRTMVGNHDMDAQGADYNGGTVANSLVDPLSQDDQNVPPYYITQAPYNYCASFNYGTNCGNTHLTSMGMAEFLKNDNYQSPNNGILPNGVFQAMGCHQRIFAQLAAAFASPTRPNAPTGGPLDVWDETSSGPSSVLAFGGTSFKTVYSWDVYPWVGESVSQAGQVAPLHPLNGC
jgi:hypothetical protein